MTDCLVARNLRKEGGGTRPSRRDGRPQTPCSPQERPSRPTWGQNGSPGSHFSGVAPLDAKTSRDEGQCEYVFETDPAVIKVLLKVTDRGDYDWVECGGCGVGWQVPHLKRVG